MTEFTRFRLVPVDGVGVLDGERVPADVFAADLEVVVHRVVVADEFGGPRRELIGKNFSPLWNANARCCNSSADTWLIRWSPSSDGPQQHRRATSFEAARGFALWVQDSVGELCQRDSLCAWCVPQLGQNFLISRRSGSLRRFFFVM